MLNTDGKKVARRRPHGFTLVELMVVVAIVGILATIAYSTYSSQVRKARRSDGQIMLLDAAQELERCYTRFHAYNDAECAVADDINDGGMLSLEGWYLITNDNESATTFRLVATPRGAQASDTQCGSLRLTQTGLKDATGTAPDRCW